MRLLTIVAAASSTTNDAMAATALVRWVPSPSIAAAGYRVYVRDGGAPYEGGPQWAGDPDVAADGSVSALVPFRPATTGANYFSVVAMTADGSESSLSDELPTGTPIACRQDMCTTKTGCDFAVAPDGTPCGEASACPDACVAGVCTHVSDAACCPACGSADPCVVDACARGECPADPGTIDVRSVRFRARASTVSVKAKGTTSGDLPLDPATTGAVVELRGSDGAVVYSGAIAPEHFTTTPNRRRHRFSASRVDPDPSWHGLTQLEMRKQRAGWLVAVKAATPDLAAAVAEPAITWVLRFGASCASRMDLACDAKGTTATCRG